jgi:hypothetical protein
MASCEHNLRIVGNSSITRRRPPTDSDRKTTGKVRFARDSGAILKMRR